MVKPIVWSAEARQDKQNILGYWFERNGNMAYSRKLNLLIKIRLQALSRYPHLGLKTKHENIRFIILRDYLIFYYIDSLQLTVLRIWDGRRNPETQPFL